MGNSLRSQCKDHQSLHWCAYLLLLLLLDKVIIPALPQHARYELANTLLVRLVLWVLSSRDTLGQPSATLEQEQVTDGAKESPIHQSTTLEACPLVERNPDSLLGCKVGVARVSEQTTGVETAVEVTLLVSRGYFGGISVRILGGLIVCRRVSRYSSLACIGVSYGEDSLLSLIHI